MRKPASLIYAVDDRPPLPVLMLSGLQHAGLATAFIVLPILVAREAGLAEPAVVGLVSISMIAMAIGAVLPALTRGPVGAGYLCPASFTTAYLAPSLLAAKAGGLPLVCGMTVFAGLIEILLGRAQRLLRPLLPPELAGLVVMLVGMTSGAIGMRLLLASAGGGDSAAGEIGLAFFTLAVMIVLSVWSRGILRMFCALVGALAGYLIALHADMISPADLARLGAAPMFAAPAWPAFELDFSAGLMLPFAIVAIAATLKTVGLVTTCARVNDADWVRPDFAATGRGVVADGLGTVAAGAIGTIGLSAGASSVGLAVATGVTSRVVAWAIAPILLLFAFLPKVAVTLTIMPRPVMAALLLFSAAFIFVNGIEIIASRLLDTRRTFVIGLSFLVGLGVDTFHGGFTGVPPSWQPLVSSSLVAGTVCALLLNLLFRLGARRTETLTVDPAAVNVNALRDFVDTQGAAWGARRDVIERARFNLAQSLETIAEALPSTGPIEVAASFDEIHFDLKVSYRGEPLELPTTRPTAEEILASDDGARRLAGYLLRQSADRVRVAHRDGVTTILFHFDH